VSTSIDHHIRCEVKPCTVYTKTRYSYTKTDCWQIPSHYTHSHSGTVCVNKVTGATVNVNTWNGDFIKYPTTTSKYYALCLFTSDTGGAYEKGCHPNLKQGSGYHRLTTSCWNSIKPKTTTQTHWVCR